MILLKRLGGNIVVYGYGYGIEIPVEEIFPYPLSVQDVYVETPQRIHPAAMASMQEAALGRGRALGSDRSIIGSPKTRKPIGRERSALSSGKDRPISRG